MPCFGPLTAYHGKEKVDGVWVRTPRLTFKKVNAFDGIAICVPCGRCVGCRMERARQWAVRCMHEARMWRDNQFLTLTYDKEHLPVTGSLVKEDLQLFMKRLRFRKESSKDKPVRFYGCGEYGDDTRRPHYHVLVFNCAFGDKKVHSENGRGEKLYTSKELHDIWPLGHNVIGDVTFDSANYVAGYVIKKMNNDKAEAKYGRLDSEGRYYQVAPEFALMSRRPGIGAAYYAKFGKEVATHDSVIVNGREAPSARFYDERVKLIPSTLSGLRDNSPYAINKRSRKIEAVKRRADNGSRRRWVKETIAIARLRSKEKKL